MAIKELLMLERFRHGDLCSCPMCGRALTNADAEGMRHCPGGDPLHDTLIWMIAKYIRNEVDV